MQNLLKHCIPLFILFVLLGCQGNLIGRQGQVTAPKHIFLIVIDTLRADHLGCYGYKVPTSPTIDRMAKDGVLFTNAYSTASSTLESVFSFFSSTTNLGNLVYYKDYVSVYSSLQKLFKKEGFNTLAVVSNPWLKARKDIFQDGFIHFQFFESNKWLPNTTDKVTEAVFNFLETKFNSNGKNFFYIHYLDPHAPYRPPVNYGFFTGKPPIRHLVKNGKVHALSGENKIRSRRKKNPTYSGIPSPEFLSEEDLDYLISKYDAEIKYVDFHIEKLLIKLKEMDILKDSLIVITADHGEEFLEHDCLAHGFQLYDETIHIPLIFYWKNKLNAQCRENLVSGIDIAPTILELCQINPPASMLGKNIFSKKVKEEPILFCTHFKNQNQQGMRTDKWKLIDNLRSGEVKIFDIDNDPKEQNNLFDNDSKKWDHLFKTYKNLISKHSVKKDEKEEKKLEIDQETKEQLKALGYL
jgi:arylsulfatase A-like enzyme